MNRKQMGRRRHVEVPNVIKINWCRCAGLGFVITGILRISTGGIWPIVIRRRPIQGSVTGLEPR